MTAIQPAHLQTAAVRGLVPMIRVNDIERSAAFYRLLGFEIGNKAPRTGQPHWAWLYQPQASNWKHGANLMLVRGNESIRPDSKIVLFYLYATDLVALRERLIAGSVKVSEISHPEYLPAGEFRTEDPDGYTLMVAQAGEDTP
jgi:catechol 2,3-dioxygenase-like lactoylglutathione lyase family enzyme